MIRPVARFALVAIVSLSPLGFSAAWAADRPDNTPPEGFVALFNGKDLTGWKGLVGNPKSRAAMKPEELAEAQKKADEKMREHWKAENGVLIFDGKGDSLCTAKDYGDFELYVDWKIEKGGDSGIYVRGTPQIQIWDTEWEPYFKHGAEKGSGSFWNNQKNPRFPDVKADNPVGTWNTFHIKMVGEKATIKLNGKVVVNNVTLENFWERDKPVYPTGQIELQNHGNTLYFKNIYVRELKPDQALLGTWKPVVAQVGDVKFPDETLKSMKLELKDGRYLVTVGQAIDEGTCKVDASLPLKTLEIVGTEGPNKGKTFLAIYELIEDELRVCYDLTGKSHPTEFNTYGVPTRFLVTYRRDKSG
jgi:uncharacterized protein (TIGR03067 family)